MKNMVWWIGVVSGIAAFLVTRRARQAPPVAELAHRLEEAWADHHTVA